MNSGSEDWQGDSWDTAELNALRAGAAMTFREKLEWLEQADQLSQRLATC